MEFEQKHLSESERVQMKGNLRAFMREHPARVPFRIRLLDRFAAAAGAPGRVFVIHPRAQLAGALGLAVVFLSVGTSYAAESALPGDVLYSVKVNVNERVAEALAPSPSVRAAVVVSHTLRRLQEAETLAAQGRLSTSVSADIQSALQASAADFDRDVEAVAHAPGGATVAADLQSNLEVTLASHARALTVIQATRPQSDQSLTPILVAVIAHAEHARAAQAQADTAIAASSSPAEATAVADTERTSAEHALSQVRSLIMQTQQTLGSTSAQAVAQHAHDAERALNTGKEHLKAGNPVGATSAFRAALRAAVETQTDVDTAMHLKNILPALGATSSEEGDATTTDASDLPPGF